MPQQKDWIFRDSLRRTTRTLLWRRLPTKKVELKVPWTRKTWDTLEVWWFQFWILRSGQDFTCIGSDMFVCSWCFHILSVVPILEGGGVTTLLFGCFVDGKFFELACFCFHVDFHVVNKRMCIFETWVLICNLENDHTSFFRL